MAEKLDMTERWKRTLDAAYADATALADRGTVRTLAVRVDCDRESWPTYSVDYEADAPSEKAGKRVQQVPAKCPVCGSAVLSMTVTADYPFSHVNYKCLECNHKWSYTRNRATGHMELNERDGE